MFCSGCFSFCRFCRCFLCARSFLCCHIIYRYCLPFTCLCGMFPFAVSSFVRIGFSFPCGWYFLVVFRVRVFLSVLCIYPPPFPVFGVVIFPVWCFILFLHFLVVYFPGSRISRGVEFCSGVRYHHSVIRWPFISSFWRVLIVVRDIPLPGDVSCHVFVRLYFVLVLVPIFF